MIEANFDGPPGPFWAQMEAAFGVQLRPMLRCCKRPEDGDGPIYDAVTKPFSRYPLAPYLEKRTLRPSVFHQGNRGLGRDRILQEGELFLATRDALAQSSPTEPNPYRGITAAEIHRKLRAELLGRFPWLATPAPARISWARTDDGLWRGSWASSSSSSSACRFPAWRWRRSRRPGRFIVLTALLAAWSCSILWRSGARLAGEVVPTRSGGLTLGQIPPNKDPSSPWWSSWWSTFSSPLCWASRSSR